MEIKSNKLNFSNVNDPSSDGGYLRVDTFNGFQSVPTNNVDITNLQAFPLA